MNMYLSDEEPCGSSFLFRLMELFTSNFMAKSLTLKRLFEYDIIK